MSPGAPPPVGQAAVTDPGGETSSGYRLVAASPAVHPEDADFLESIPQVSDHLHTGASPGPYLSFCRLPSGAWALTRRFTHGTRRGTYHRIVVHSLAVPEEVLAGLAGDPWLLLGKERLRTRGGGARSFADLGLAAAEPGVGRLPDLECVAPADPRGERHALLARRLAFLRREWGEGHLGACLAAALGAVEAGRRLLLPEGSEGEQLLALGWSALPAEDRRETPWTTHLAPGSSGLFRLAMTPEAEDGRGPGGAGEWTLFDWRARGGPYPEAGPGARALADALLRGEPAWAPLEEGLERRDWALALARDGAQVRRWTGFCALGRSLPADGFATAWELGKALETFRLAPEEGLEDPWLRPAGVLRAAAATLSRLHASGHDLEAAREEVGGSLRRSGLASHVLAPGVVSRLRSEGGAAPGRLAAAAVALALMEGFPGPAGRGRHEALLDLLLESAGGAPPEPAEGGLVAPVLEELAAALLAAGSSRAERALGRVAASPGCLLRVYRRFPSPRLDDLLRLARAADDAGDAASCAALVGDHLVPALAGPAGGSDVLPLAEIEWALNRLRPAPAKLAAALRRWDGRRFDVAAGVLRRWAGEDETAARAVAREMADPRGAGLRTRASVLGLAAALARAGVPARDWAAFAVAEAAILDDGGNEPAAASFLAFLRSTELGPEEAARAVAPVLEALAHGGLHRPLRGAHRALVRRVEPGFVTRPTETLQALERLAELPPSDSVAWAGTVASVARTFEEAGLADRAGALRLAWWRGLEDRRWDAFPAAAIEMLDALGAADRQALVERWLARLETLGDLPGEPELVATLAAAAAPDPELSFRVVLARLIRGVREGRMALADAVAHGESLAWSAGRVAERRRELLARLLPRDPANRGRAVLDLLVSPRVWQTTKRALETAELRELSHHTTDRLLALLPPVEELGARPAALLAVAEFVGCRWQGHERRSRELLRQALAAGHPAYAVHFLRRSEESWRRSFVRSLERQRDADLLRRLRRAARTPAGAEIGRYVEAAGSEDHA